jgi:hypothetical protein
MTVRPRPPFPAGRCPALGQSSGAGVARTVSADCQGRLSARIGSADCWPGVSAPVERPARLPARALAAPGKAPRPAGRPAWQRASQSPSADPTANRTKRKKQHSTAQHRAERNKQVNPHLHERQQAQPAAHWYDVVGHEGAGARQPAGHAVRAAAWGQSGGGGLFWWFAWRLGGWGFGWQRGGRLSPAMEQTTPSLSAVSEL